MSSNIFLLYMTTTTKVEPGPCGFVTIIEAKKVAPGHVYVSIKSGCEDVLKMNIGIVDAINDLFNGYNNSKVYKKASKYIKHVACPVPCAILKTVEVEAELAVPKDVTIEITKED